MASVQRQRPKTGKSHGFDIWAEHVPGAGMSDAITLHLAAVAVDLPATTKAFRWRLLLIKGVMSRPHGQTRFVAARLLRQADEAERKRPSATNSQEATHMTDKELSEFGGRLYEAVLFTPLPAATVFSLALAVRQAIPWAHLPQHLKFAVFKIVANCTSAAEDPASPAPSAASNSTDSVAVSAEPHGVTGQETDAAPGAGEDEEAGVATPSAPSGDGEASAA